MRRAFYFFFFSSFSFFSLSYKLTCFLWSEGLFSYGVIFFSLFLNKVTVPT